MSMNRQQIDLNSDVVLSDPRNDDDGVNLSENRFNVGDSDPETVMQPLNDKGSSIERVIDRVTNFQGAEAVRGVDESVRCQAVVDGLGDEGLERKSESFDRGNYVESRAGSVDRGIDVTIPAIDEEGRIVDADGSEGGQIRDGNEIAGVEAEQSIDRLERDISMHNEKEETCAQVVETVEGEGDRDVKLCPSEGDVFNQRECVTGKLSSIPEEINQSECADTLGSMHVNMEHYCSGVAESSGDVLCDISRKGVKVDGTNETMIQGDLSVGTHVTKMVTSYGMENQAMDFDAEVQTRANPFVSLLLSEVGVSQSTGDESSEFNLVVDLNSYVSSDEKLKSGAGTGHEGTEVKDVSCAASREKTACHANGFGFNENQYTSIGEQATDVQLSKKNWKKMVKSTVAKSEFCSDLVWGKVRSHPWWPGQIFDPVASSAKAKKYYKKDSYLIAYFGDQTFAWNEASKIKPFQAHFSKMEKQSSLEDFHHAVDCALDEVSRRMEFGLACSCIPEEVYAKIKTQIVVNTGIREESSTREDMDRLSSAVYFKPLELVQHVKALARFPYGRVDRLKHVIARAQLLAFYRWKGYPQLSEFKMIGGLLESDEIILLSGDNRHSDEVIKDAVLDLKGEKWVPSEEGKLKNQDNYSLKRKRVAGDRMYPSKKKKSLLDLMAEYSENRLESKATDKLISSPGKRCKVVGVMSDELAMKHRKSHLPAGAASKSSLCVQTFGVGDSIPRFVNQLNWSTPSLKCGGGLPQKTVVSNNSNEKSATASVGFSPNSSKNSKTSQSRDLIPTQYSSPGEILSQLCLAAQDPMKRYSFVISVVAFFSEFRNSVSLDCATSLKQMESLEEERGRQTGKEPTESVTIETSELDHMKDSYWTDMVIESIPEKQSSQEKLNKTMGFLSETPSKKGIPTVEPQTALGLGTNLGYEEGTAGGNSKLKVEKPVGHLDGSCKEDFSPTALILNFTNFDSVPSETNLNKIFSRFGPLNESETEVMKKSSRAKVVFKRIADAETAFSSAGKYSIFGPSLVSYSLRYFSTPSKASSRANKRSRKGVALVKGDAS